MCGLLLLLQQCCLAVSADAIGDRGGQVCQPAFPLSAFPVSMSLIARDPFRRLAHGAQSPDRTKLVSFPWIIVTCDLLFLHHTGS